MQGPALADRIDQRRNIPVHIHGVIPCPLPELRLLVDQVRREDPVEQAVPVGLVELVGLVAFL